MKLITYTLVQALLFGFAMSVVSAGPLRVSNSKGFSSNPMVDRNGALPTSVNGVVVAVGTFESEPGAALPGADTVIGSGVYANLLAEFTPYGDLIGLVPSVAPLDLKGVFSFQDLAPVGGTPLAGKAVYVIVAKGPDLANATEAAIIKTDGFFAVDADDNALPELIGVGTGLGSVVIVGSDSLYTAVPTGLDPTARAAYSLAEIGNFGFAPTDLVLSPDAVIENAAAATVVGLLSATDADVGDSFTYSLVAGSGDADNAGFTISGDELRTAAGFDHEVQAAASVRVRVVDSYGLEFEKNLMVTITDDRSEDFDEDGLTEAEEEDVHGTSDLLSDSDDDGFDDGFEVAYGFDPASDLDGTLDRDGDGWADWLEVRLGTDADVAGPGLEVAIDLNGPGQPAVRVGPGGHLLGFRLWRDEDLVAPWTEIENYPAGLPLGQTVDYIDETAPADRGFYRVEAYPLPLPVTAADGFNWVTVGDGGNVADLATGFGAVAGDFQISTYEVTIGQWVEFLNAKQASEPASGVEWLWLPSMVTDLNVAGIARNGTDGSYTYEAIGSPVRPVTFVSWFDAARYVNWLHNGKGAGSTESGVYDLSLAPELITRAPGSTYFLPNDDEWCKAAYYDPSKGAGDYWLYPTRSDDAPVNELSSGPNFANFASGGDYTLTPGSGYSGTTQYLTLVGSFTGSASHYGTYDQGGNVWEWTESTGATTRIRRGGSFGNTFTNLQSTTSFEDDPATENAGTGFRIARPAP